MLYPAVISEVRFMIAKTALILLVLVLVLGTAAYFLWIRGDDCSFSSKKRSLGIDLEAGLSDVKAIKGKVGISDDQVRDYDDLGRDLAQKYDMLCQDHKHKRVNDAEYLCRRKNMDEVLNSFRSLLTKTKAAAGLADPSAQKEVVLRALSDLEDLEKKGYGEGCTSSMNVSPKTLSFLGHTSEHTVQISNSGNNLFTYSVVDLPRGFLPQPSSGGVTVGQTVTVAIVRTAEPIPNNSPVSFRLRDNFMDEVPVELSFDQQNATLYEALAENLKSLSAQQNRAPTVEDALKVVDDSVATSGSWNSVQNSDSLRYFLAAGVLSRAGNMTASHAALDAATTKNRALDEQPATHILRGIVLKNENRPNEAIQNFSRANALAAGSKSQKDTAALTGLLSGAVAESQGKPEAATWLGNKDVQEGVRNNPKILDFAANSVKTPSPQLKDAVEKASTATVRPH
jgi:tetratricopeptide (TPR) repeat protein